MLYSWLTAAFNCYPRVHADFSLSVVKATKETTVQAKNYEPGSKIPKLKQG